MILNADGSASHAFFGLGRRIDQLADDVLSDLLLEVGANRRLRDLPERVNLVRGEFGYRHALLGQDLAGVHVLLGGELAVDILRDGHALVERLLLVCREAD